MKLASETERSVILSSSRRKRKRGNGLQLVKRPAPHVSGTCACWAVFGKGFSGLLRRAVAPRAPDRSCLLFLPASRWPPPSLRSSGRSPTSPAPTSCGSRCSPSPTTGRTTRRKAAAGPSRLRRAATPSSRYGLAFPPSGCPRGPPGRAFCWAAACCWCACGACLSFLFLQGTGSLRLSVGS